MFHVPPSFPCFFIPPLVCSNLKSTTTIFTSPPTIIVWLSQKHRHTYITKPTLLETTSSRVNTIVLEEPQYLVQFWHRTAVCIQYNFLKKIKKFVIAKYDHCIPYQKSEFIYINTRWRRNENTKNKREKNSHERSSLSSSSTSIP